MRSIAVITILAQMGSFVPATEAYIPVRDRICTRFGTSDAMEENASTFGVEMTDTAFILEACTSKSLVLIDELGRGTTNAEGLAIAWGVSEELIQRRAYTCFATHYHELNELANLYPRGRCYHLSATLGEVCCCMFSFCLNHFHLLTSIFWISRQHYLRFQYKMKDGPFPSLDMYGIKTAKICGLPLEIVREAEQTYSRLSKAKDETEKEEGRAEERENAGRKKRLLHHLLALRYAELDYPGTDALRSSSHVAERRTDVCV